MSAGRLASTGSTCRARLGAQELGSGDLGRTQTMSRTCDDGPAPQTRPKLPWNPSVWVTETGLPNARGWPSSRTTCKCLRLWCSIGGYVLSLGLALFISTRRRDVPRRLRVSHGREARGCDTGPSPVPRSLSLLYCSPHIIMLPKPKFHSDRLVYAGINGEKEDLPAIRLLSADPYTQAASMGTAR